MGNINVFHVYYVILGANTEGEFMVEAPEITSAAGANAFESHLKARLDEEYPSFAGFEIAFTSITVIGGRDEH